MGFKRLSGNGKYPGHPGWRLEHGADNPMPLKSRTQNPPTMLDTANRTTYVRQSGTELGCSTREEGMPTHWKTTNENFEVCIASKERK